MIRGQRAALQRWKTAIPWYTYAGDVLLNGVYFSRAGEITVANGGDIAKQAGLFPQEALIPEPPPLMGVPHANTNLAAIMIGERVSDFIRAGG